MFYDWNKMLGKREREEREKTKAVKISITFDSWIKNWLIIHQGKWNLKIRQKMAEWKNSKVIIGERGEKKTV